MKINYADIIRCETKSQKRTKQTKTQSNFENIYLKKILLINFFGSAIWFVYLSLIWVNKKAYPIKQLEKQNYK